MVESAAELMRRKHLEQHPNCTFGDKPHFVPPSFGQVGFYLCEVLEDLRNHTRCQPPFDHDHADHRLAEISASIARGVADVEAGRTQRIDWLTEDGSWVSAHRLDRIGSVVIGTLMPYDEALGERVRDADGVVWNVVADSVRRCPTVKDGE